MTTCTRIHKTLLAGLLMLLWMSLNPMHAAATTCGECNPLDEAVPPFLTAGPDPNLLMLIDNSASMLDLAYVDDSATCYEDFDVSTYDPANTAYAGYFQPDGWYTYDFSAGEFEEITLAQAGSNCGASEYKSAYLCVAGTMTSDEMTAVSGFYAMGNLLNWVAGSKLDIQKEILTGGKYDSTNQKLKMESRGCGNRRFIKKIPVMYGASVHYVTLAVRPPRAESYETWEDGAAYTIDDVVTNYDGSILYQATSAGTSNGTGPLDDTGVTWVEYWGTLWHSGTYYSAGALVSDPGDANTIDTGKIYIATTSGTASGTGVHDDSGVSWEPYDLTMIDIFKGNATGFDDTACQAAIDEISSASPSQGLFKGYIDDCMGTTSAGGSSAEADANNAFNHGIHNCWYRVKHGTWISGTGTISSTQNACEAIYTAGIQPWEITPEDRAYVCFGQYTANTVSPTGYVGRCWNPGDACITQCKNSSKVYPTGCPNPNQQEVVCGSGGTPGWDAGGYADVDTCIDQALKDYCDGIEVPEVIDPSDQVGADTGDTDITWGLPAMLTDSGVVGQLDQPIATMQGFIAKTTEPLGLVQEYAYEMRMGAMVFNDSGSASECNQTDPFVLYECTNTGNKDGGKVIEEIGQSTTHTDDLVSAINDIKANSWTPLAEAFYNAVGYFSQDSTMRLNTDDFTVGTSPIEYWCQNNNILIITEGASTADQHSDVATLAGATNDADDDNSGTISCGTLDGSTFLDDLAWYAHNTDGLLGQTDGENNQNIDTHIVAAGELRTDGTGECSPETLLTATATNGGTTLEKADDIASLEAALRRAFSSILKRASAGSAASVISATRSGEGAVYQAIFWPTVDGPIIDGIPMPDVTWAGEVHALLVDAYGLLYEDTDGDMALSSADERVVFYFDESTDETLACYGDVENSVCTGTVKSLTEVKYLWSAAEWLSGVTDTDITANRSTYISADKNRYVFTWNDLDNDGIVDSGEVLPFVDTVDWNGLSVDSDRRKVPHDFGILTDDSDTNTEVNEIVNWIRGKDATGMRSRELTKPAAFNVTASANNTITWRLGDVIYSTPTAVGKPAEGYHLIYQDSSYAEFAEAYNDRRQMIYFGGNDGMLHALNGGFFQDDQNKYCRSANCTAESSAPELGAEMWAYVPYNLQPNLKCLTVEGYEHRYYVDQKPRIFDVRIFSPTTTHPQGWGTILVAGMRLGGSTVNAVGSGSSGNADTRQFTSAYMIFDITDPEQPPTLLGELTYDAGTSASMGFSTPIPTVVPMTQGSTTKWYLVLGSGPTTMDGQSTQTGKVGVFPLDELAGSFPSAFRIPDAAPSGGKGRWVLDTGFVSDLITVDFDLEKDYRGDAIYFGTVEGTWGSWSGKMYRIVTNAGSAATEPSAWSTPKVLIDPDRPITAAPSIGYDGSNHWVYFGTGRFFDKQDKSDTTQNYFFGIKEPVACTSVPTFTWDTITATNLLRTDQILVQESILTDDAGLSCTEGSCLPTGVSTLYDLMEYTAAGPCSTTTTNSTVDGWYQYLPDSGERNIGQATLLGGLLTYTSYVPYDDICQPDGMSYLYALYYQTGTAWHQSVFNSDVGTIPSDPPTVVSRLEVGHGLASTPNLHVGREDGAKAFVQTSTGAIVEIEQPNLPLSGVKSGRINWRND